MLKGLPFLFKPDLYTYIINMHFIIKKHNKAFTTMGNKSCAT